MFKFERVKRCKDRDDINIPVRKTKHSAGYDFEVAEDTVIPPYFYQHGRIEEALGVVKYPYTLNDTSRITKQYELRPTLVPTGIKCKLEEGFYLELTMRSSAPLKHWLIMANSVGKNFWSKLQFSFS